MDVTLFGIFTVVNPLHPASMYPGICVASSSNIILLRESQSPNGPFVSHVHPAVVRLFGISIYVRESQLPNAIFPSSTRFFDSFTLDRLLQFSNALSSISVTVSGITTLVSSFLFLKTFSPIVVTV